MSESAVLHGVDSSGNPIAVLVDSDGKIKLSPTFGTSPVGFTMGTTTGTGAQTIAFDTTSPKHEFTFGAGNAALTLSNPANPCNITLKVVQDSVGSRTTTWAASSGSIIWMNGGAAPTLTTTADAVDLVTGFFDGTDWYLTFIPK